MRATSPAASATRSDRPRAARADGREARRGGVAGRTPSAARTSSPADRLRRCWPPSSRSSSSRAPSRSRCSSATASSPSSAPSAARRGRCAGWSPARPCSISLAAVVARGAAQPARRAPRAGARSRAPACCPPGLDIVVGWLPVRRRPRRRGRHDAARGIRERAARLAHPPDRRAAREHDPAPPGLAAERALPGSPRSPAAVAVAARVRQRPRRAARPAAAMVLDARGRSARPAAGLAVHLADRAAARARSAAGRGCWRARTPAPNLRRVASVATPLMLAVVARLHALLRQDDAPAADEASRPPSGRRPTTCSSAARQPRACPPDVAAAARAVPGVAPGLGLVRDLGDRGVADGKNLRTFPARGVDAATLSARDRPRRRRGLAERSSRQPRSPSAARRATQFGWHVGDRVALLARGRDADHAARRRDLRAPARLRRHRAAARARRTARHPGSRRRRVRRDRADGRSRGRSRPACSARRTTPDLEVTTRSAVRALARRRARTRSRLRSTPCSA